MNSEEWIVRLLGALIILLIALGPFAILWVVWHDLSQVLRRQERARCFIDLLQLGLQQGRTPEQTILSLASSNFSEFGDDFAVLSRAVQSGQRLSSALETVPKLVPPSVSAIIRVGEELGDLGRVLPVAGASQGTAGGATQTITNSMVVFLFVSPIGPLVLAFLAIWIFPKLNMLAEEMLPGGAGWSPVLFEASAVLAWCIAGAWVVLMFGETLGSFLRRWGSSLPDRFDFSLPWRRQRMQRNFSSMLALLLDAGVPEAKALRLAAGCAVNLQFRVRAEQAALELERGVKLTDAVGVFGNSNEFSWRLRNAAAPGRGFAAALAGWHEALAAKAFQQQQAASQLITTGFVILNGVMVGLVALGLFTLLIAILEEAPV